jgi:hypothetical protein
VLSSRASPPLQAKTKDASNDGDLVPGGACTNEKFRPEDFVDDTDKEQATAAMQCG